MFGSFYLFKKFVISLYISYYYGLIFILPNFIYYVVNFLFFKYLLNAVDLIIGSLFILPIFIYYVVNFFFLYWFIILYTKKILLKIILLIQNLLNSAFNNFSFIYSYSGEPY